MTFTYKSEIPLETQQKMKDEWNFAITELRKKYHNLIFTNYRDFGRKRIGFSFAYKLMTKVYTEEVNK